MDHKLGLLAIYAVALGTATAASAQGIDGLGSRQAALGAFVAVADDASAVAWNPAGLASGPFFNFLIDFGRKTNSGTTTHGGRFENRSNNTIIALGVPPLGVSYYRLNSARVVADGSDGAIGPGRQEDQVEVQVLTTQHVGATVLQSLGDHLTVGATARLVQGRVEQGLGRVSSLSAGFDQVPRSSSTTWTADLDAGVMWTGGRMRAGLMARNLTTPRIGDTAGLSVRVSRQARAGLAWGAGWPGRVRTMVAVDADLTRVEHPTGDRRDVAAGAEHWWAGERLALRGGLRVSTVGAGRAIASVGASAAVRSGLYLDAHVARGRDADWAWGVGAHVVY